MAARPLLGSLRARLIASHVFVLLLALALVLAISAVGLRRYERGAQEEELLDLAIPLTVEARLLLTTIGLRDPDGLERVTNLLRYQAREMEVRALVLSPAAEVVFDSEADAVLTGQTLDVYANAVGRVLGSAQGRQRVLRTVVEPTGEDADPFAGQIVVLAAGGRSVAGLTLREQGVLMLVAPPRRQGVTGRFLPPLLVILATALAVAAVAGYLLSRRIAAPVARLTAAADAMAAGRLEQRVPEEGPDELGRLVASFNAMSRQIATTYRSQRKLLADIAHELRTPLTSVQGYAQALRDGVVADDGERRRALATIGAESDRMARLIRQLLELARLESGQTTLDIGSVAVGPVLERVQARFRPEAERRGVALLIAEVPDGQPPLTVRADEERLGQILDNLVGNALRHTPAGGEVVLAGVGGANGRSDPSRAGFGTTDGQGGVGRARRGAEATTVRLTVRDTGSGIEPERLPGIFDRFARGEEGAGREGFGLGLAIVKELVQAHGGVVSVASRPGQDTVFAVELPAGTKEA